MDREEAISIIENEIRIGVRLCTGEQVDRFQTALYMAISALRSDHNGDAADMMPLTLEQLREMVDKPAYLYIYDTALSSGWHIIKAVTEDKIIFRGSNAVYVPISSLGKCFDLYAYQPAQIDLEAWTAEWNRHYKSGTSAGPGYVCSSCDMWNNRPSWFCPSCGKAMTPEAWAELEKRVRGRGRES